MDVGPEGLLSAVLLFPTVGFPVKTVITIELLFTVVGEAQVAFEVITTVIVDGARRLVAV